MNLTERIAEAHRLNLSYPGYGRCYRCQRNWKICNSHCTMFKEDKEGAEGCFPLCQECWEELTPDQRLVYYQQLWAEWLVWGERPMEEWQSIENAVKQGL
jgi:hypothetical protein